MADVSRYHDRSALTAEKLIAHLGHDVVIVSYGGPTTRGVKATEIETPPGHEPANIALECETCSTVLADIDHEDHLL